MKSERITIRIATAEKDKLMLKAKSLNISCSELILLAINEYLNDNKPHNNLVLTMELSNAIAASERRGHLSMEANAITELEAKTWASLNF